MTSQDPEYPRYRESFRPLMLPKHAHPLVVRLFEEANRQRTTVTNLADKAGVSRVTINSWRWRANPTIGNLVAVLTALGLELRLVDDGKFERGNCRPVALPTLATQATNLHQADQ